MRNLNRNTGESVIQDVIQVIRRYSDNVLISIGNSDEVIESLQVIVASEINPPHTNLIRFPNLICIVKVFQQMLAHTIY